MGSKSERREQAIVEAARDLFYRHGVAGTPIGAVAAEAGVEKGHLTYYFGSRRELLSAVATANRQDFEARFATWTAVGGEPADVVGQFIAFFESQAESLATLGCPIGTLCSEVGKTSLDLQREAAAVLVGLGDWLSEVLGQALDPVAARRVADQLLVLAQGAAVLAHARRDPQVVRDQAAVMRQWIRDALGG